MVDDRIREVLKLQLAGKWRAGKSHLEFAERYGVAIKTVQDWATQASRFQRMCLGDDVEVRMQLVANVQRGGRIALKQTRTYENKDGETRSYDCPDVGSYLKAQELTGKFLRVFDKPEANEPDEPIPEEQLAAALRQLGWKVTRDESTGRSEPASPGATGGAEQAGEEERDEEGGD